MLMVSNIKKHIDFEYCAFLDEEGFNLLEGESCLIRISSNGF